MPTGTHPQEPRSRRGTSANQASHVGGSLLASPHPRLSPSPPSSLLARPLPAPLLFLLLLALALALALGLLSLRGFAAESGPRLKMSTLDVTRAELALLAVYLNKAEARDKICRAIQYGSKFLSNGEPGTAQNVDKTTSLARKVFRLFKFINDLNALISPPSKGVPLPLILIGKSKNALLATYLFLDQFVWLARTGIYKNKDRAELISRISLYCWMGSCACTTLIELAELKRLSNTIRKLERDLKEAEQCGNEQYQNKLKQSNERLLALVKSSLDLVVAVGLLQLAPRKVTPRVTGAFGFASSIISCYQLLPAPRKDK